MKMIVEHVPSQRFRHGSVSLVCVHNCRQDILLAADDLNGSFVGVSVELLRKIVAAVVEEISGVYVEDQLSVKVGVFLQSPCRDRAVRDHLIEHFGITSGRRFEVDVILSTFRNDVLIDVGFFLALIMALCVDNALCREIYVSCTGAIDTIASCHRQVLLFQIWNEQASGDALLREV